MDSYALDFSFAGKDALAFLRCKGSSAALFGLLVKFKCNFVLVREDVFYLGTADGKFQR